MQSSTCLRIAYFGLPLGALLLGNDGHELVTAVLSPIEAPGRRRLAARMGAQLLEASVLADDLPRAVERALAAPVDLVVSWFWTRKLPLRWIERARLGGIGAHPSLLPRHRGPNPYFWAIDAGDTEAGVTVHRLEADYDTGKILDRARLPVGARNSWQLARALDRPALALLRRTVRRFATGEPLAEEAQDPDGASAAPEPAGELLRADFRWPTARVLRRIRALSPVPGLALELAAIPFFVTEARATSDFAVALAAGEAQIVGERLVLRTGDGALAVERAQLTTADDEAVDVGGEQLARVLAERLGSRSAGSYKGMPR